MYPKKPRILDESGDEIVGVTVAHCFRDVHDTESGEVTLTTVDERQGVGRGTIPVWELALGCRDFLLEISAPRRFIEIVAKKLFEQDCRSGALEAVYELKPRKEHPHLGIPATHF